MVYVEGSGCSILTSRCSLLSFFDRSACAVDHQDPQAAQTVLAEDRRVFARASQQKAARQFNSALLGGSGDFVSKVINNYLYWGYNK